MVMLTVKRTRTEIVTLDIEFPLYFTYDVMPDRGSWVVHIRLEENGRRTTVRKSSNGGQDVTWEVEVEKVDVREYATESGGYEPGTPEQFENALTGAKLFVAAL